MKTNPRTIIDIWKVLFSLVFFAMALLSQTADAVEIQSIDFLSDDSLCGILRDGKTKCYDWNMKELWLPDSIVGFKKPSDIVASDSGICGYDQDGAVKCLVSYENGAALKKLLEETRRGSVVAHGYSACGVALSDSKLVCLVPKWSLYERGSFKASAKNRVGAIGISSDSICWADGDVIRCHDKHSKAERLFKFDAADRIVVITDEATVCARNAKVAKCWLFGGEVITLSDEFFTAKKWFDNDELLRAISADNRLITLNLSTGKAYRPGLFRVPPPFEQSGNSMTDLWIGHDFDFCAVQGISQNPTCWRGYAAGLDHIKFSEPISGFALGFFSPCALLASGQIQCKNDLWQGFRSLSVGYTTHARVYRDWICVWNEKVSNCDFDSKFQTFESIFLLEANKYDFCAVGRRMGANETEVLCSGDPGLDSVPFSSRNATSVSVWNGQACAVSPTGLFCWGKSFSGVPRPASFLNPLKVQLAKDYGCALDAFGIVCWGEILTHDLSVPPELNGPNLVKDFALGENRACALVTDGTVKCWGKKTFEDEDPPALSNVSALYGSREHVFCAINPSGVHCWGGNNLFPR